MPGHIARRLALLLSLALIPAAGALINPGMTAVWTKNTPPQALSQPADMPIPTDGFMHARVAAGGGNLPVYESALLAGPVIGRLTDGEITAVEIYTQDVGRVIGSSAELFGGYVRLSMLEEIPDENSVPEGEPYRAVIKADSLSPGPVALWFDFFLSGETVGSAMPGEEVIAQDYDSGYSAEITLPSGLVGFVALEHLTYVGPYTGN